MNWKTMESAPRDGTQILVFVPSFYQGKGGITWAVRSHGEWLDSSCRRLRDADVTHWMPIPDPPSSSSPEAT